MTSGRRPAAAGCGSVSGGGPQQRRGVTTTRGRRSATAGCGSVGGGGLRDEDGRRGGTKTGGAAADLELKV
uniref:Uncharacterized protein n=2 Tax=Oryza sativa subsp. japonica TaxID=39947 RepID=Q2R9L9_ORYSJ|nr:hypothetical protein [Oryza sativa Japonica Group]AAY23277.1 hypothetical protein LOC_Os11g08290 [Oryza sativa Japonica Group]ABA91774.1 hypothetical protein LOC_Os11g08290 [Oryza sativa Japonica Group]